MNDYPDISNNPNIVFLSIEELYPEIQTIQGFNRPNNLIELTYLIEETINVISVNSRYEDNLIDYLKVYIDDIKTEEDKHTFEIYSTFINKLADSVARQLKSLQLYSLDDVSYYKVHKCHSLILFSLIKITPTQYWQYHN